MTADINFTDARSNDNNLALKHSVCFDVACDCLSHHGKEESRPNSPQFGRARSPQPCDLPAVVAHPGTDHSLQQTKCHLIQVTTTQQVARITTTIWRAAAAATTTLELLNSN